MSEQHQTKSYSFRLPADLKQRIDAVVKQRGQTKSGFLRIAIEEQLRRYAQESGARCSG
jgi:predicted DNA-binding protein